MKRFFLMGLLSIILILVSTASSLADTPPLISYQGELTDNVGDPVNATVSMVFTIYDDAVLSNPTNIKWQEVQLSVVVTDGQFSVTLGDGFPVAPLLDTVFNEPARWLGIKVGADPEMTPRTRMTSVAYANRVSTVDGATGGIISGDVSIQSDLSVNGEIDATGPSSKIRFYYATFGDLPDPNTYHGMFAHVNADGTAYYAHAGSWVALLDETSVTSNGWVDDGSVVRLDAVDDSVGIGTAIPKAKHHVVGDVNASSLSYGFRAENTNSGTGGGIAGYFEYTAGNTSGKGYGLAASGLADGDSAFGLWAAGGTSGTSPSFGGMLLSAQNGSGPTFGGYGVAENFSTGDATGIRGLAKAFGSGSATGGYFETTEDGSGAKWGIVAAGVGNATSIVHGVRGVAINNNVGGATAASFEAFSNGTGTKRGVDANAFANGNAQAIVYTGSASTADGNAYGLDIGLVSDGGTIRGADLHANTNSGDAYGIETDAESTSGTTNGGRFTATGGSGTTYGGRFTATGGAVVYGVRSDAETTGSGVVYGVRGGALGTGGNGVYGLYGDADNGSNFAYGGYFTANNSSTSSARAVYATGLNAGSGLTYGVYASASSSGTGTHYGLYAFESVGGSGAAIYASGDLIASGAKPAVVRTSEGERLMYAVEAAEVWFEDIGSGQLQNGEAHIELDRLFLETVTIDVDNPLKVFIQLTDDCKGTFVKAGATGFDAFEIQGGTSNATFTYRVMAKRKGYESERMRPTDVGQYDVNLYPERAEEIEAYLRDGRDITDN